MNIFLLYIFFAYLALAIQAIVFKGIKPDFVLVLVCFYSFKYGKAKGITYGALAGLLMDTASGFIIGPNIISKALSGFLIAKLRENIFQWNFTVNTIVITIFSIMDICIVYICFETFLKMSLHDRPWGISVMGVIYTIIAALVLYSFFNRERHRFFQAIK